MSWTHTHARSLCPKGMIHIISILTTNPGEGTQLRAAELMIK